MDFWLDFFGAQILISEQKFGKSRANRLHKKRSKSEKFDSSPQKANPDNAVLQNSGNFAIRVGQTRDFIAIEQVKSSAKSAIKNGI